MRLTERGRIFTIIEPHHDDFALSIFGTILKMDMEGMLDKIKIISCFSVGKGDSKTPTKEIASFFKTPTEVVEMVWHNLMPNPKENAKNYSSLEEAFETSNGMSWEKGEELLLELVEGQLLLPLGYCNLDHNLLSRINAPDALYYAEYPYFYHYGTSNYQQSKTKHLMTYRQVELFEYVKLETYADYKWKITPALYADVFGQFNPLFEIGRPWYKSVRTEMIYNSSEKGGIPYGKTSEPDIIRWQ